MSINYRSGSAYSAKSRVGNSDYSIDKLVDDILLGRISNIVCVVGAGISTLSGIPDFRFFFKLNENIWNNLS